MIVRFIRGFLKLYFSIFHAITIRGAEHIPKEGAFILASNHPSYFDPVLLFLTTHNRIVHFLAESPLFSVPGISWLMKTIGTIPVHVDERNEAAVRKARMLLKRGYIIGIFPEGQRSPKGWMGFAKRGVGRLAIDSRAPVIPVTIHGAWYAWPSHRPFAHPQHIWLTIHPPMDINKVQGDPADPYNTRAERIASAIREIITRGQEKWGI